MKEFEQNYGICNHNDQIWKKLTNPGKMKGFLQIEEFDQIQECDKIVKKPGIWTKLQEFEQNSGLGIRLRNLKKIKRCDKLWEIRKNLWNLKKIEWFGMKWGISKNWRHGKN